MSEQQDSPTARDRELVFALADAQPEHPMLAEAALRVLAVEPWRTGMTLMLGRHYEALDRNDDARRMYEQAMGLQDTYYLMAVEHLLDLELYERNNERGLELARILVKERPEHWWDLMELGHATASTGDFEAGWELMEQAVAMCARNDPDSVGTALTAQNIRLALQFAPPERQVPVAEAAIRADPSDEWAAQMLVWGYMQQYRFDEAEQLALRLLSSNPTDELMPVAVNLARAVRTSVENGEVTVEKLRSYGVIEDRWREMREETMGIDLRTALAALDECAPAPLRASLRSPAAEEAIEEFTRVDQTLLGWHDGQSAGAGDTWGVGVPLRLMTVDDMEALDALVQHDPAYASWTERGYWDALFTDDAGSFLVVANHGRLVLRSAVGEDLPIAASLVDWMWDRIAAFGGPDARKVRLGR